jgi:hypothetical protein
MESSVFAGAAVSWGIVDFLLRVFAGEEDRSGLAPTDIADWRL